MTSTPAATSPHAVSQPVCQVENRSQGDSRAARALITIVTVVFDSKDTLESTIRSVISQSSDRIEYLIIDGGSTDGSLDIIRAHDAEVDYWVSESDNGIYDAFNKGVRLAKGTWILFLGAGDQLYDRDSIARAVSILEAVSDEVNIAYGRVVRLRRDGLFLEEENEPWVSMRDKWKGGRRVMPQHQGIFARRCFLANHPFDVNYRIVADYKSFTQAIAEHPPAYLDCVIARVSLGGVSSAPRQSLAAWREIVRLNQELGRGLDELPHQLFFGLKSAVKTVLSVALPTRRVMAIIDLYRKATKRRKMWT